jgi:hypothetical protein
MTTKPVSRPNSFEGAARVVTWVQSPVLQPMNEREMTVIHSLFAWVAAEQDTNPDTVREITEARFASDEQGGLKRKDYDDVIRFLVDLRIDEMRD